MSIALDNFEAPRLDPLFSGDESLNESQSLLSRPQILMDALSFREKKSVALLGIRYLL